MLNLIFRNCVNRGLTGNIKSMNTLHLLPLSFSQIIKIIQTFVKLFKYPNTLFAKFIKNIIKTRKIFKMFTLTRAGLLVIVLLVIAEPALAQRRPLKNILQAGIPFIF